MEKGKLLRVGKISDVMRGAGMTKRVRMRLARAWIRPGNLARLPVRRQ